MTEFWKSAGLRLVEVNAQGRLAITPDLLRAYYMRPELHPVDESCADEIGLFQDLMADPFLEVGKDRIAALADEDAVHNWRAVLAYRAQLLNAGTIEGAYLAIMRSGAVDVPPLFIDQMVHLILRNVLADCQDPMRLRAAELFFREQVVSAEDGHIMLADEEVVDMYARTGGAGGLGQLLLESATPMRRVELDVLDEDNKTIYWERSDRFDTVVDFRFTQPALDAFARVVEAWIAHFLTLKARVQPRVSIKDEGWRWHVGLDREASRILDALYEGEALPEEDLEQIIALFQLDFEDAPTVMPSMRGKPVYLGLAMTKDGRLKVKPQNLLLNLPLAAGM